VSMKIGYACITLGVPDTDLKSCIMKNASEEKLKELIASNLNALDHMLEYNHANKIRMFRISSDLIPFGSSPVNQLQWWKLYEEEFRSLGDKIKKYRIRVSMHPGQYTVLNSPDKAIVERAIHDLRYHARVLDSLNTGPECKIILHIGGVYQEKEKAIERFKANYSKLEPSLRQRLVIENDDKSYNMSDVLAIGSQLNIPVVFDNLHHQANPSDHEFSDREWVNACKKTWTKKDGVQKLHYSQQGADKKPGSHSASIQIKEFLKFCQEIGREDVDIMLEVKDKNLSAMKCINSMQKPQNIDLESEWNKYKFSVLEKSSEVYEAIVSLLHENENYSVAEFYSLIETALNKSQTILQAVDAVQCIWEYFSEEASLVERQKLFHLLNDYREGNITLSSLKNYLRKLTVKYQVEEIISSYYFIL
jgi:UV DNA damage endonuclease